MAIEDLYGKVLAFGVQVIRRQTALPALVNHTTTGDRSQGASVGGITEVIVPPEFATRNVVPGSTPPASQGPPAPTTVQVPLDYWKEVNFPLTEKHIALLENADRDVPMFLANAVAPIVEEMTASIAANYKGVYGFVGTPGTTPFAASPQSIQDAKKVLTQQKAPRFMRQAVMNTDAYANAVGLPAFRSFLEFGSDRTVREGEIDRAYGFDWHEDAGMDGIRHTAGTAAGYLVNQANHAAGATTVTVDTGAGTILQGDIFTVAGDSQTYAVVSYAANVITYVPAAKTAFADNAAITFKASHAINLAFHPFAFAFDSRPAARLKIPGVTSNFMTWIDDMTGTVLRLEIRDEYHQVGFYMSCLWGTRLVDARLACRVAG